MPVFEIEMLWDCDVCKATLNRGLERHCRNCGHPKDDRDREYMPDNVTIQMALEGDKKRRAEAGPDWKCLYCGSLQNPLNKCCTECGVPQGENAKKAWDAKTEEATFDPTTGAQISHAAFTEHVEATGAATRVDTPSKAYVAGYRDNAADIKIPRFAMARYVKRAFIAAPCIAIFGVLMWLLFRTKVENVRVSTVSWKHDVKIERYQVFHHDGWSPETNAFNVHDEGSRIHHYDHVKTGSHNEPTDDPYDCKCKTVPGKCHTTKVTCKPNGNGTATCSGGDQVCDPDTEKCQTCYKKTDHWVDDYQDVPRYQDYYEWDVWDWGYNRTVTHSGASTTEDWPSGAELQAPLRDGEREREAGRNVTHKVTFSNGNDTWEITPDSCQEFERYPVGTPKKIKVGVAHGVEVLP